MDNYITTTQAAVILKKSIGTVVDMIHNETLPANKVGNRWAVNEAHCYCLLRGEAITKDQPVNSEPTELDKINAEIELLTAQKKLDELKSGSSEHGVESTQQLEAATNTIAAQESELAALSNIKTRYVDFGNAVSQLSHKINDNATQRQSRLLKDVAVAVKRVYEDHRLIDND